MRITGTNGQLPRRALQSTLLDRCESISATPLTVCNLCKPTLPAYPPAEDRYHWRVMSHLGTRFLNMMSSAEVLRGTLSLYNWRRMSSIIAVWTPFWRSAIAEFSVSSRASCCAGWISK